MSLGATCAAAQSQNTVFGSYYPAAAAAPTRQAPPAAPAGAPIPCDVVAPSAEAVAEAVSAVDVQHWRLSREQKDEMDGDVDSMHRDLAETLPGLIQRAKATPNSLGPEWAVVQNVDALYDVMVRVTTAAQLAASKSEAAQLLDAQNQLGQTRKNLTDRLVMAAKNQDLVVVQLQTKVASLTSTSPSSSTSRSSGKGHGHTVNDDADSDHPAKTKKPVHKVVKKAVKKAAGVASSTSGGATPAPSH